MCKLLVAACFFACTINTQAKVLYLPDPIRYETNGQLFTRMQPISYESLIKRLGKPIKEDAGCAKTIDYPNASFIGYEEGVMPNKNKEIFFIRSINLKKPQDKVVFQSFTLSRDSTFSMVKKFNHQLVQLNHGISEYFFDIPSTKIYDGYGYILYFKNQHLTKLEEWRNIC